MQLRERAELTRRGLLARYVTVFEAVAWADDVIQSEAEPPIEILDLSLAGERGPDEAAAFLQPLTAEIPPSALLGETVADMQIALNRDDHRAALIARELSRMALQGLFPPQADLPELYAVSYGFDPEEADWAPSGAEALTYLRETLKALAEALK